MCGISGILRLDGTAADPRQLDTLTDGLTHRGPDGRGTWIEGSIGLGHRRLRIIDLSDAASQPMHSADGRFVIVFNGEIYNYQPLRRELEAAGVVFRSQGDTEVLVELFAREGTACLKKLRGMFAFAAYDRQKKMLTLVRDRVGKKPIKFFEHGGMFAFASELKALRMLPACPQGADQEAMHHFLTMMYVPSPMTGIESIEKLPAGHALTIDCATGKRTLERYWSLSYETDEQTTEAQWKEQILSALHESVRLRMIADVPVGAFLSGGIDSAAVVAYMQKMSSSPVKTFTIGSEDPAYDETADAETVARFLGTEHRTIRETLSLDMIGELVRVYEEPFADPSVFPTWLVAKHTRSSVTVALNGDGGDEAFLGYVRYPIIRFSQAWGRVPLVHPMVRFATEILHLLKRDTFSYRVRRFQRGIGKPLPERHLDYLSFFTDDEKAALERAEARSLPRTGEWYARQTTAARARAHDVMHAACSADMDTYLADDLLPKVDMGTMAHALEARSPFLDHELLELAARIPARYKIHGGLRKWILRDALKDMLPHDHLLKKKRGFRVPLNRWFRGELRPQIRQSILDGSPAMWSLLDKPSVERFLNRTDTEPHVDMSDHIWALLWLSEWTRQYTPNQ